MLSRAASSSSRVKNKVSGSELTWGWSLSQTFLRMP